jgi:hypothetical protein
MMSNLSDKEKKLLDRRDGELYMDYILRMYKELNNVEQFDCVVFAYVDGGMQMYSAITECVMTMEIVYKHNNLENVMKISSYIIQQLGNPNNIGNDSFDIKFKESRQR